MQAAETLRVRGALSRLERRIATMALAFGLSLGGFLLESAPALAQPVDSAARGAARSLGYEGIQAYQAGDIPTAVDRLERAYQVLRVPSLALWSARALEKSGKWVEASERYLEATRLPIEDGSERSVQEQAQMDARSAEAELRPRIPLLVIEVRGASASDVEVSCAGVTINRALLGSGLPTNPGEVPVLGVTGDRRVEVGATALEGQKTVVVLDFTVPEVVPAPAVAASPAPSAPSEPVVRHSRASGAVPHQPGRTQRWLGWGLLGGGGGFLALGAIAGGLALAEQSELEAGGCSGGICPPGTDVSGINTMRVLSSVGFIAGGVLAATGTTLLLTAPKSPSGAVRARLGFAAVQLEGSF